MYVIPNGYVDLAQGVQTAGKKKMIKSKAAMSTKPDRTLELISAAYSAAIAPDRFEDLLAAWDLWCDDYLSEIDIAFEGLSPTFEDAVTASETLKASVRNAREIDTSQAPMVLLDASQTVLAWNSAASSLVARGDLDIAQFVAARSRTDLMLGEGGLGAYRCSGGANGRVYLVVEAPVTPAMSAQHPEAVKVLTLSIINWDDAFAQDLRIRFGLSEAELRVARGLLEGLTAQEISGVLGRSVATIRSHIKALLSKSGARRQMEFVQLLTILRQTTETTERTTPAPAIGTDFQELEWSGPAGELRLVRYGQGRPVIYFTTSSLPEEVPELRHAFAQAGFEVTAPARPGFRGTARGSKFASEALLEGWLERLAADVGPNPLLVGHREGGIVAAKAASWFLKEGKDISGLVLVSTGAPTKDIAEFETAPPTIKRSFRAARYAQTALTLGYHTAARVFQSGRLGEDKIIDYFFRDSPEDAARIQDPRLKDIMRRNLAFCFEDPSQIARDVHDWGTDWSPFLEDVAAQAPVLFLHGQDHTFRLPGPILQHAEDTPGVDARLFENAAQLLLYRFPREIVSEIAKLL